jgi:hypothetical protein
MLDVFFRDILKSKGVIVSEGLALTALMDEAFKQLPDGTDLLVRFKNAYDAYTMIRGDHEMRSKISDIWQLQLNICKSELLASSQELSDYLANQGLTHLSETYLSHF